MTRVRNCLVKESEFSSAIFPIGVIGLTLVLGIMLKKYILGYYFWLDENSQWYIILLYIYYSREFECMVFRQM